MNVEVRIPEVGESITEGVLAVWLREDGELVGIGDDLFELETDKVTMAVPAEVAGRLSRLVPEGEVVEIGQAVAAIDTSAAERPGAGEDVGAPTAAPVESAAAGRVEIAPVAPGEGPPIAPPAGLPQARARLAAAGGDLPLSPAVRRLIEEHGLDARAMPGSGKDGRLTKEDVLRHLEQRGAPAPAPDSVSTPAPAAASAAMASTAEVSPAVPATPAASLPAPVSPMVPVRAADPRETRVRMSRLRHRIAERLVQVQHEAAILTTFNEADMSAVIAARNRYKGDFQEKFDTRLGFMSFFVKAAVDALKTVPGLNARLEGEEVVYQHYTDIGVAVGTEHGLLVPVVRDADALSFAEIERRITDFARRARERKIALDELTGGCFTISNGGIYGSLLSTPILNPPQSGILGLHRIEKRPVVVSDQIVIRPMMYLALSYDHRIVDGAQAVTFLKRIVDCIEDPERMLLEV